MELISNMFCLLLTHTSTHLNALQHQVSYDARARLWVREDRQTGRCGGGGYSSGNSCNTNQARRREKKQREWRGGRWDGEEEKEKGWWWSGGGMRSE